jgi:hypothetical protein
VKPARPRAYLVLSAAYFPALTLLFVSGAWAVGKPYDGRAVVGFLVVTALAGAAVGALLRRQIVEARGTKVILVAILALVLGTPLVVLPELLFGLSGLGLQLDFQGSVLALLVATLAASFNPILWAAGSGFVLLLRRAAAREAPPAEGRAAPATPAP